MTVTETRTISMTDLRNMCVRENYMDMASEMDYAKFLNLVKNDDGELTNVTPELIGFMAIVIINHSSKFSDVAWMGNFLDPAWIWEKNSDMLTGIMYNIGELIHSTYTVKY